MKQDKQSLVAYRQKFAADGQANLSGQYLSCHDLKEWKVSQWLHPDLELAPWGENLHEAKARVQG